MNEIGPEGAALLAQVIPVGVLIVAVERRALGSKPYPKRLIAQISWWAQLVLIGLGTGAAVLGAFLCVVAAVREESLAPVAAAITIVGGSAVAYLAINTTMLLAMRSFWDRDFDR